MKQYICSICGYIYDEAYGNPEGEIKPGTTWGDVVETWVCPLCGAAKSFFRENVISTQKAMKAEIIEENESEEMRTLSFGEVSALCSNLSKGCEKQYRSEEADLFNQLAIYYKNKIDSAEERKIDDLWTFINEDLDSAYSRGNLIAEGVGDRGTLRALVWGEKVTRMQSLILNRYEKQQDAILENTNVYVCEICGFVYIGNEAPEICPVCKVPKLKISEIKRG